jgi:peptidoglycan hydrolase CwlO-like protein
MARRKPRVSLPLDQLTTRQLVLYLIDTLEKQMADLNQSVAELEAAVDAINVRFATELQNLQHALDAANEALAAEELDDAAKDAALQEALAEASSAALAITNQVAELNAIGAEPTTPVEPDPDGPHPDQSLPGDQPVVNPLSS